MTPAEFYSVHKDVVSLKVKARAGAGQDKILGVRGGELLVAVRAVAEKGRANQQLIRVLSVALGVSRDSVRLKLGTASSHKVFELPADTVSMLEKMRKET